MSWDTKRLLTALGVLLVGLASAPGDPQPARSSAAVGLNAKVNPLEAMARARLALAQKMYENAWKLYRQSSSGSASAVYFWSNKLLEDRMRLASGDAERLDALQEHRGRMARILELSRKVQKLGFSRKIDMDEASYYVLEADFNLAIAHAQGAEE